MAFLLARNAISIQHTPQSVPNFVDGNHNGFFCLIFIKDWNSTIKVQKILVITKFLGDFLTPELAEFLLRQSYLEIVQDITPLPNSLSF